MFKEGQVLLQYVVYGGIVSYNPVVFVGYLDKFNAIVIDGHGDKVSVSLTYLSELK